jgi:4-amino-4-deoxy-L-arabinose transferase-like glycosyltransferase
MAQMTRGMMGLALPAVLVLDMVISGRRPPLRYAVPALAIAFLPPVAWYAHLISAHGRWFFLVHSTWLENEVYGPLSPAWRRFTGPFEYAWMLAKSYWPWLPFMIAGLVAVIRSRDRRLWLLNIWTVVVFEMCSAARSRVLRYMLPAYPAFALLSALGHLKLVPARYLRNGLRIVTPVLGAIVLAIAWFPPTHWHATEIRPIALAATAATPANDRVVFYDAGQPRFDETNQLQWLRRSLPGRATGPR